MKTPNKIKALIQTVRSAVLRRVLRPEARTHDYTRGGWGHDCTWKVQPDRSLRILGWGGGIKEGDYIILKGETSPTTRYRFREIAYEYDPPDMWRGIAEFAPRPSP